MMQKQIVKASVLPILMIILSFFAFSLFPDYGKETGQDECVNCHTNVTKLKEEAKNIPEAKKSKEISGAG